MVGTGIENAVDALVDCVPPAWRAQRERRDNGASHHVTLLSKRDLAKVQASGLDAAHAVDVLASALQRAAKACRTDAELLFRVLGVGSAVDSGSAGGKKGNANVAVFAVLDCAALNEARATLNLPAKDLHITLGFARADVHDVAKDASTLIGSTDELDRITAKLTKLSIS